MRLRRFVLPALLLMMALAPVAPKAHGQQPPPQQRQYGERTLSSVVDWQSGSASSLLISNNVDGELRLNPGSNQGSFVSAPIQAGTVISNGVELPQAGYPDLFNAVGATWRADIPQGTGLRIEVRGTNSISPSVDSAPWTSWYELSAGDARSQADDGAFASADVRAFPASTRFLQARVSMSTNVAQASAVLESLSLYYFTSINGPFASPGLPRVPIAAGQTTLTPRPTMVQRSLWAGTTPTVRTDRATPRGIIVHGIDVAPDASDPLVLLRALASYQTSVLGWDDMPYHYIIDGNGSLYEGRFGGPTSAVRRLAGGDNVVHIALLGDASSAPSDAAQATLTGLVAWLAQTYDIALGGEHSFLQGDVLVGRPNLAAHNEVVPDATDPGASLRALVPQLRTRANDSIVRSRWYFAEGNVQDYSERLALFNPTANTASATVSFRLPDNAAPVTRILTIPAGGRTDLAVNDIISTTNNLPTVVESNANIIVERAMGTNTDIDGGPGTTEPSRIWYFAEGSTAEDFKTYLVLFNPQTSPVDATITYMRGDGTTKDQKVRVPAQQRTVISVGDPDVLPGVGFGTRVLATLPIIAERTMRFGANGGGLHVGKGISELSRSWYFAEGTTQRPYQMRILVLNPNAQPANTTVTFSTIDGTSLARRYVIPPTTRLAIDVNEVVPDLGISTSVQTDRPVAVERAMYFNDGNAGMATVGAIAPAYTWRFADGRTTDATEYLLFSNPSRREARVTVEFVLADGSKATREITMPGNARATLVVHEQFPNQSQISATVRATQKIIAERSLFPGGGTRGGATALGIPEVTP